MKPKRQKKAIVTEPLAAVKRGLRKRPTSSIGAEVRRSHIAKKMLVQEKRSSSQPPTIGPRAIAAPAVAHQKPIALALSARSVKTLEISESVAGKIIAAPSPITQRAVISWPGVLIRPPSRLAPPKTPRPASNIPLRPTRSLRLPEASSSEAKPRL